MAGRRTAVELSQVVSAHFTSDTPLEVHQALAILTDRAEQAEQTPPTIPGGYSKQLQEVEDQVTEIGRRTMRL